MEGAQVEGAADAQVEGAADADAPATIADGDRLLSEGDVDAAQAAYERAEAEATSAAP